MEIYWTIRSRPYETRHENEEWGFVGLLSALAFAYGFWVAFDGTFDMLTIGSLLFAAICAGIAYKMWASWPSKIVSIDDKENCIRLLRAMREFEIHCEESVLRDFVEAETNRDLQKAARAMSGILKEKEYQTIHREMTDLVH